MSRIKVFDIPLDIEVSKEDMRKVLGGAYFWNYVSLSKVYTLNRESGQILFGDGESGARPSSGVSVKASYRD
jgi:hypothetical protein